MTLDGQALAERCGRQPAEATRRDVVRCLLSVPTTEALASLPGLRRSLIAAGNSFSPAFWDSAEQTLRLIESGSATVGDVQMWRESTGTEPTTIVGTHVWDDESERTALAEELYGLLVAHLEEQVAVGRIDPDRLAVADRAALRDYVALQDEWLRNPLPDGRLPGDALLEEQDEDGFAAWDAVDAAALQDLEDVLDEVGPRRCPSHSLQHACAMLRAQLGSGQWPYDLLATAGGVDTGDMPTDDTGFWLSLATGTIRPVGESPATLRTEDEAAWLALEHVDWLGAIATLARSGAGTDVDATSLADYVEKSDDVEGALEDPDDRTVIAHGFGTAVALWQALGAVDDGHRLTELGWWGLPEALRRAWTPSED